MQNYLVLSDLHFGLSRSLGITTESARAYEDFQFGTLHRLLESAEQDVLIIPGDLLDSEIVSLEIMQRLYTLFNDWQGQVIVLKGNHDEVKDRTKLSSLAFLAALVPNMLLVDQPTLLNGMGIIPHMANQNLFDEAVAQMAKQTKILLTHCCYDNPFAVEKDHSLNLSPEQADLFDLVVLGHEHNKRSVGNVHVLGSPWPCSISEAKVDHYTHVWDGSATPPEIARLVWDTQANYVEIPWTETDLTQPKQFTRITGVADSAQAGAVIQAVSKLRTTAPADTYLVTNSVQIQQQNASVISQASEDLENFDPMKVFYEALPEKYREKVKETAA